MINYTIDLSTSFPDARFRVELGDDLALYFRDGRSERPRGPRVQQRNFPLAGIRFRGRDIVSHGSCNHVPMIDSMIAAPDLARERESALADVHKAQAALAAAEAKLRGLS